MWTGAISLPESHPFHSIFGDSQNLPITRQQIPEFLRAPASRVGAVPVLALRHLLALWAAGGANFLGLIPGASGNVDELRSLCKSETPQRPELLLGHPRMCTPTGKAQPKGSFSFLRDLRGCLWIHLPSDLLRAKSLVCPPPAVSSTLRQSSGLGRQAPRLTVSLSLVCLRACRGRGMMDALGSPGGQAEG